MNMTVTDQMMDDIRAMVVKTVYEDHKPSDIMFAIGDAFEEEAQRMTDDDQDATARDLEKAAFYVRRASNSMQERGV